MVHSFLAAIAPLPAHADVNPDDPSNLHGLVRITNELTQAQKEVADLGLKADLIFSYVTSPVETIARLADELNREQIAVGIQIQAARREGRDSKAKLEALEARYSQIFDERIQVYSKRRLPTWLIGNSKHDIESLMQKKFLATQKLHQLEADYARLTRTSLPAAATCFSLFVP